jgi:type I restriction-modification system DNA methylase subunit
MLSGNGANGDTTATLGFEAKLWRTADALRNNMDAAEYKHVVLGLIFLKYISDAFEAKHAELVAQKDQGAEPEDPDVSGAIKGSHLRRVKQEPWTAQSVSRDTSTVTA